MSDTNPCAQVGLTDEQLEELMMRMVEGGELTRFEQMAAVGEAIRLGTVVLRQGRAIAALLDVNQQAADRIQELST